MKRSLLFIFTLLTITLSAVAQPRISSNKETHHFGQIEWKRPVSVEYTITNTGDKPLILENVTGSCGCTVPEYPKEPIAPGASSEIKVVYKPGKQKGLQNKLVTVIANTQPKDTRLNIIANVHEVAK